MTPAREKFAPLASPRQDGVADCVQRLVKG